MEKLLPKCGVRWRSIRCRCEQITRRPWPCTSPARYPQAIEQYKKTIELDPNYAPARGGLGRVYTALGQKEQALAELEHAASISNRAPSLLAALGHAYGVFREREQALTILARTAGTVDSRVCFPGRLRSRLHGITRHRSSVSRAAASCSGTIPPRRHVPVEDAATPAPNAPLSFTLHHVDPCHPYLAGRGLAAETIRTFGVGLYRGRGFLRGRIVIPIHDEHGALIAYAGRAIDGLRRPRTEVSLSDGLPQSAPALQSQPGPEDRHVLGDRRRRLL